MVGLSGKTVRFFNPHRVLLGAFSIVLSHFTLIIYLQWVNFLEVKSVTQEKRNGIWAMKKGFSNFFL